MKMTSMNVQGSPCLVMRYFHDIHTSYIANMFLDEAEDNYDDVCNLY